MNYFGYIYVGFKKMAEFKKFGMTTDSFRIIDYFSATNIEQPDFEIFAEKSTNANEQTHLDFIQQLINKCQNAVLVIVNMFDFSTDETTFATIYESCWKTNVSLRILDTPWFSIDFLKKNDVSCSAALSMIYEFYKHDRYKNESIKSAQLQIRKVHLSAVSHNRGRRLTTKKEIASKSEIIQLSRDFNGHLADDEVIKEIGISRNTFYKYKREIRSELQKMQIDKK